MNKHFSAILEFMDNADRTPKAITLKENKDIEIEANNVFDFSFWKQVSDYCEDNNLKARLKHCKKDEVLVITQIENENTP
jgi:pyruvate kinase